MSITIQTARARIYAFSKITGLYPNLAGYLRNGVIPDNDKLKSDFGILENEYFGKAGADSITPLTLTEICSFNTWFNLHPDKVAGKEVLTTSVQFPVSIKGTKEDILNTVRKDVQITNDDELLIAEAEAEAIMLMLTLNS